MCGNVHVCVHNHISVACIAYTDAYGQAHTHSAKLTHKDKQNAFQMNGLLQGRICTCIRYHDVCMCVCVCFHVYAWLC